VKGNEIHGGSAFNWREPVKVGNLQVLANVIKVMWFAYLPSLIGTPNPTVMSGVWNRLMSEPTINDRCSSPLSE